MNRIYGKKMLRFAMAMSALMLLLTGTDTLAESSCSASPNDAADPVYQSIGRGLAYFFPYVTEDIAIDMKKQTINYSRIPAIQFAQPATLVYRRQGSRFNLCQKTGPKYKFMDIVTATISTPSRAVSVFAMSLIGTLNSVVYDINTASAYQCGAILNFGNPMCIPIGMPKKLPGKVSVKTAGAVFASALPTQNLQSASVGQCSGNNPQCIDEQIADVLDALLPGFTQVDLASGTLGLRADALPSGYGRYDLRRYVNQSGGFELVSHSGKGASMSDIQKNSAATIGGVAYSAYSAGRVIRGTIGKVSGVSYIHDRILFVTTDQVPGKFFACLGLACLPSSN